MQTGVRNLHYKRAPDGFSSNTLSTKLTCKRGKTTKDFQDHKVTVTHQDVNLKSDPQNIWTHMQKMYLTTIYM